MARTAYLLLTPRNRPELDSLANLRPGAAVVGEKRVLKMLAEAGESGRLCAGRCNGSGVQRVGGSHCGGK